MMDRNGEDWSGDDISHKASAPGGARDDAGADEPANADEGADPQKDIDLEAGNGPAQEEHMTPHPGSDFAGEEDREKDPEEEADDENRQDRSGVNEDENDGSEDRVRL